MLTPKQREICVEIRICEIYQSNYPSRLSQYLRMTNEQKQTIVELHEGEDLLCQWVHLGLDLYFKYDEDERSIAISSYNCGYEQGYSEAY